MNPFCANECDYHQHVINSLAHFPDILKSGPGLATFAWGHEVDMLDAGRGGGKGAADFLTVDEAGLVWLIEAKFDNNRELGRPVWEQLARYRKAVAAMSWQQLLHYTEAFLKGREKSKPQLCVPPTTASFEAVLDLWQKQIGRCLLPPRALNDRMAQSLQSGSYGIMVLADRYEPEVIRYGEQFQHNGPVAYALGVPTSDDTEFCVPWFRPATGKLPGHATAVNTDPRFSALRAATNLKCEPATFADTLGDGARDLWLNVLKPGLLHLGWDGQPYRTEQKAFHVAFEIHGKRLPLLVIGWPEADAKDVSRVHKLAGQSAMKINPQLKWLFHAAGGDADCVSRWAARFYRHGWRGRKSAGMRDRWGIVPITAEELRSPVDGCMLYYPTEAARDHNGRPGDRESLEGLLQEFAALLAELHQLKPAAPNPT